MARKKESPLFEYKQAMRRAGRERTVEAMREGRVLRPITIQSAKRYRRRPKHGGTA